jgi:hypothetical protein
VLHRTAATVMVQSFSTEPVFDLRVEPRVNSSFLENSAQLEFISYETFIYHPQMVILDEKHFDRGYFIVTNDYSISDPEQPTHFGFL